MSRARPDLVSENAMNEAQERVRVAVAARQDIPRGVVAVEILFEAASVTCCESLVLMHFVVDIERQLGALSAFDS